MNRGALSSVRAQRWEAGRSCIQAETLAEETPVALVYNGRPHAVMMATPADLDDFALGFTLTEGIAEHAGEVEIVDRLHTPHGISLQMLIPQARFDALGGRERSLTGRTGCGLCGAGTLEAAIRPVRRVPQAAVLDAAPLLQAFAALEARQPLNAAAGSVHAAALLAEDGELYVREDVGRHNAIDKAAGMLARAAARPRALLVTSRASYEVVHKAAQIGCPVVAAISAPTALAVRLAEEAGMTLIGFARRTRMTLYAGGESYRERSLGISASGQWR